MPPRPQAHGGAERRGEKRVWTTDPQRGAHEARTARVRALREGRDDG